MSDSASYFTRSYLTACIYCKWHALKQDCSPYAGKWCCGVYIITRFWDKMSLLLRTVKYTVQDSKLLNNHTQALLKFNILNHKLRTFCNPVCQKRKDHERKIITITNSNNNFKDVLLQNSNLHLYIFILIKLLISRNL